MWRNSYLKSFLTGAVCPLLGGCLISKEPLITENDASYPLAHGTLIEEYDLTNKSFVPRLNTKTGETKKAILKIESGYYVYHAIGEKPATYNVRFRTIGGSTSYVAMVQTKAMKDGKPTDQAGFAYALITIENGYYILYSFDKESFDRYRNHVEETAPDRWKRYLAGDTYRLYGNGIEVRSLSFLEQVLPAMVSLGFRAPGAFAYKPAGGTPLELGLAAYAAKDYATAFRLLRPVADKGLAKAQVALANMYMHGWGVALDRAEALRRFRIAAEGGEADAQYRVALAFEHGSAAPRDKAQAAEWYERAANQGHAEAQARLAWLYLSGEGVAEDTRRALALYREAAEQGYARAQHGLGWMYERGKGTTVDERLAVHWFRLAARNGEPDAQVDLGLMIEKGRGVSAADPAEAARLYSAAAEKGHLRAKLGLAYLYANGRGVARDLGKAETMFSEVASKGSGVLAQDARNALRQLAEVKRSQQGRQAAQGFFGAIIKWGELERANRAARGSPSGPEWKAKFWCRIDFYDPHPTEKPTYCRTKSGGEWRMHWLDRCYGQQGWCDG